MLEALRDGTTDYLATDHAPHTLAEKERGVSGQPHLDTYGPFVTWLLVEQGFTPRAHRGHVLGQSGRRSSIRISKEKFGRLLPGYVGSLTVLDLRRADDDPPRRLADALRLEPVRRRDVSGQRGGGVREGLACDMVAFLEAGCRRLEERARLRGRLRSGR